LYSGLPGDETYRARHTALFRKYLDLLSDPVVAVPKGARVLDVGSGDGYFVEMARGAGLRTVGCDLAAHRLPSAGCCTADSLRLPFPNSTFDLCTLWFCLEHFPHPVAVIGECRRVTRSGGAIAITVPRAGAVLEHLQRHHWSQFIPGHVAFFSLESLRRLLGRFGYRVTSARSRHQTSVAQALVARGVAMEAALRMPLVRSVLLKQLPNPITNVITVTARLVEDRA